MDVNFNAQVVQSFPFGFTPPLSMNISRPLFYDPSSNTGDFLCDICGKRFKTHQRMLLHRRYHEKRPFRCVTCNKNEASYAKLVEHMNMHVGLKPHECIQCGKRYE